jgi:hypothetical protein
MVDEMLSGWVNILINMGFIVQRVLTRSTIVYEVLRDQSLSSMSRPLVCAVALDPFLPFFLGP